MQYYVISPNVWDDGNFEHLLEIMCENHCVLMGYDKNSDTGKTFSYLKKGDVIIVAQRRDWKFNYYFIGTICNDETNYIENAQCKYLSNFCLLTDEKTDFLKDWSAAGMRAMTAMVRIDPNKNQNVIKMIDRKLNGNPLKANVKQYIDLLIHTHNLILHGAPGTGKTHLAREIAAEMKAEVGFVQFHPSYDYTDFVEGLRPVNDGSGGQIGFERKDGVFKKFCERALKESKVDNSDNFSEIWDKLINELNENNFVNVPLLSGRDTMRVELNEYGDGLANRTYENDDYVKGNWIRGQSKFFTKDQCYNIYKGLLGIPSGGHDNYRKAIVKYMKDKMGLIEYKEGTVTANVKPFLFIIDEINRGEMSKIFGELFFAIEPGYRGKDGLIQTQYQNLVPDGDTFSKGFYVPENVYIIGTMNDIDRNVESMDFAFRRRFTFKEIKAKDTQKDILCGDDGLDSAIQDEAIRRMDSLNKAIDSIEGLSSAYHIGGAYFLKLKDLTGTAEEKFAQLWEYHLEGLLREYLRGMEEAEIKLAELKAAYENKTIGEQKEIYG